MIVRIRSQALSPVIGDRFGHTSQKQSHGQTSALANQNPVFPGRADLIGQDPPPFPFVPRAQPQASVALRPREHRALLSTNSLRQRRQALLAEKAEISFISRAGWQIFMICASQRTKSFPLPWQAPGCPPHPVLPARQAWSCPPR